MSSKSELIAGQILTFSGVLDAAIGIIDHYSRWEVLVNLQEHVAFLAHPATPVILLVLGLILIHRSLQAKFAEAMTGARESQLQDEHGNRIIPVVKPPSLGATYAIILLAVCSAFVICAVWLLNYSPMPPVATRNIAVPVICKTADCWPRRPAKIPPKFTAPQNVVINAPGGIPVTGGTVNNPTVVNNAPPPPVYLSDHPKPANSYHLKTGQRE